MIFALLTLVASLALAVVSGWFSIVGLMAILAGQPIAALVLGATLELGKLVTTSWLYRNWDTATWKLKGPLIYFTFALMLTTSMGVFGFLSKAHLEQGAPTMDNASKIERITQEIDREKSLIADNDKVIQQLDATVNSFLGKDRTDRALSVRRSQTQQRKQLKEDSENTQKHIETLNDEKFKLESDLRKLQLEVGPIRYIADLIYGSENSNDKTLESAVRIFTLIIVSTLDPLAITLLIAANSTILKLQNEKEKIRENTTKSKSNNGIDKENNEIEMKLNDAVKDINIEKVTPIFRETIEDKIDETIEEILDEATYKGNIIRTDDKQSEAAVGSDLVNPIQSWIRKDDKSEQEVSETKIQKINEEKIPILENLQGISQSPLPVIHQPMLSRVSTIDKGTSNTVSEEAQAPILSNKLVTIPWASQSSLLREILGSSPHFTPQKLNEEKIKESVEPASTGTESKKSEPPGKVKSETSLDTKVEKDQMVEMEYPKLTSKPGILEKTYKYPKALSWVNEFKRT
jgi:hypothetical protein